MRLIINTAACGVILLSLVSTVSCQKFHRQKIEEEVERTWPVRTMELSGVLELTDDGYLAIKLEKPIIVNPWTQQDAIELQIIINSNELRNEAYDRIGSKIWIKGLVGPRETVHQVLPAIVSVKEMKYY